MKQYDLNHWNKDLNLEGLLYFAQRMNEMLFDYTLDTYKGRMFNSFMLCTEAVQVIDNIKSNIIKPANLEYIVDELNWSLKNDKVISSIFGDEKNAFFPIKYDKNKISELKALLVVVMLRILPVKYEGRNRELLKAAIQHNKKKDIESLLDSWLCMVKLRGYSDEWLYHYTKEHFFNSKNNINKIESLDIFFQGINFEKKTYDVYLICTNVFKTIIERSSFKDDWLICDNLPVQFGNKKIKNRIIIKTTIDKCLDIYSAQQLALNKIDYIRDLFAFFHHKRKPYIEETVFIVDTTTTNGRKLTQISKPISKGFDNNISSATSKLDKLIKGNIPSEETMGALHKVFDLHSLCVDSKNYNNQILNLWTAIEIIIPLDKDDGRDKIVQISETLSRALSLGYASRLFRDTMRAMINWDFSRFKSLMNDVNIQDKLLCKFIAFVVLPEYESKRSSLFSELDTYPLLRNRLFTLTEKFSKPNKIKSTLEAHEQKLAWQIRRLYRARNLVVHESGVVYGVETLITNAHTYLDEFVSLILRLIQDEQCVTNVEQSVIYIEKIYHYKIHIISQTSDVNNSNYKSLLLWK